MADPPIVPGFHSVAVRIKNEMNIMNWKSWKQANQIHWQVWPMVPCLLPDTEMGKHFRINKLIKADWKDWATSLPGKNLKDVWLPSQKSFQLDPMLTTPKHESTCITNWGFLNLCAHSGANRRTNLHRNAGLETLEAILNDRLGETICGSIDHATMLERHVCTCELFEFAAGAC